MNLNETVKKISNNFERKRMGLEPMSIASPKNEQVDKELNLNKTSDLNEALRIVANDMESKRRKI